jgi:integrase
MGRTTFRGQICRALDAIDHRGESKHLAKREQGWKPGEPVYGIFSDGTQNTVFDRAMTFANWLKERHPNIKRFRDVDEETVREFMAAKTVDCRSNTVQALLSALRKLQEGLLEMKWIRDPIVPEEWEVDGHNIPRGAYPVGDAEAIIKKVGESNHEYAQVLRFILASGARIDEVFHLRSDKVFTDERKVELLGKGGKTRRVQVLQPNGLFDLDLTERFVYLDKATGRTWKDGLRTAVRKACDDLGIPRRGVHGFRGTAAGEFMRLKELLGYDEGEARRELAQWLGHNPHRTEVTYAYVPRR